MGFRRRIIATGMVGLAFAACAASVEVAGDTALTGAAALEAAGCSLCDRPNECSGCFVQGFAATYRCPVEVSLPESACSDLDETTHSDLSGERYACFYCPD